MVYKRKNALICRATVALALLTLLLLCVANNLLLSQCGDLLEEEAAALLRAPPVEQNVARWLKRKLPTEVKKIRAKEIHEGGNGNGSACFPVLEEEEGSDHLGSLIVLGEITFPLELQQVEEVKSGFALLARGAATPPPDAILATLSGITAEDPQAPEVLKSLRDIGMKCISLAASLTVSQDVQNMLGLVQMLQGVGMEWVGQYSQHFVMNLDGKKKLGFVGFCGVYGQCGESTEISTSKYSPKLATSVVERLQEMGVAAVIAMVQWGKDHSVFPDETMLAIARHLSKLGVSLVLGQHSRQLAQGHAYFGKTLVIFSPGCFITADSKSASCWNKDPRTGSWTYRDGPRECKAVHPLLQPSLLACEQMTRVYNVKIARSGLVTAEYRTVPLVVDGKANRRPDFHMHDSTTSTAGGHSWTKVCGSTDSLCLSCVPM